MGRYMDKVPKPDLSTPSREPEQARYGEDVPAVAGVARKGSVRTSPRGLLCRENGQMLLVLLV